MSLEEKESETKNEAHKKMSPPYAKHMAELKIALKQAIQDEKEALEPRP